MAFRSIASAIKIFAYDCSRFARYAGCLNAPGEASRRASLVMAYHQIEKGLTMPRRRMNFGHQALLELISIIKDCQGCFKPNDLMLTHAIGVVKEYRKLHLESGAVPDPLDDFWMEVSAFCDANEQEPSHQLDFTRDSFCAKKAASFPEFARSRHTVRHFCGPVPIDDLTSAVELAMTAPSACNRQPIRVHCVSTVEKKDAILNLQNGNRGFGRDADRILVLSADLATVRWAQERNDLYTNGGIFLMNLSYALHYYGYGSCILNWSVDASRDRALRRILPSISEKEEVFALLAVGALPETFRVAASPRHVVSEILDFAD